MAVYTRRWIFHTYFVFKVLLSCAIAGTGGDDSPVSIALWVTPCAGSTISNSSFVFNETVPSENYDFEPLIKAITVDFLNLRDQTSQLKKRFADARINNDLAKVYNAEHLHGFPVNEQQTTNHSDLSIGRRFIRDFDKFSRVAVFLNQTVHDEKEIYFNRKFRLLEKCIYNVLCKLKFGIHHADLDIEMHVSGDIMSNWNRSLSSRTDRDRRDYILVKDSIDMLDSLIIEYRLLLNPQDE